MESDVEFTNLKYLVVGAGFYGSVIAERIANDKDERVLIIDKRDHFGGNCFSKTDVETGIEFHKYGTHIFHTSNERVWKYINAFTTFNEYRHQVLTTHDGKVYQMPINLETINSYYGINLKPFEVDDFLKAEIGKEKIENPQNLEEKVISLVGRRLYEAFIKGYTQKQWQSDLKQLPASIIDRLPVRKNYDENYFFNRWQGVPTDEYSEMFRRMLGHNNIDFYTNVDFVNIRHTIPASCLIVYSGAIDRFFDYKFGKLEWRTLEFEKEVYGIEDYQGTAVMNYANASVPYTRVHEPRHLHVERNYTKEKTLIIREYSKLDTGSDPYYPINTGKNKEVLDRYLVEMRKVKNVIFGGRLGDYKYYDMDETISRALETYENIKNA